MYLFSKEKIMRNEKLIHALGNCINHCNYCADACLDEEEVKKMVGCIRIDRVCAEVCSTVNQLLAMNFDEIDELVAYCAKICERCAEEFGKHPMEHCQKCAEACKSCAEACRELAA